MAQITNDVATFSYKYQELDERSLDTIAAALMVGDESTAARELVKFWINLIPPARINRFMQDPDSGNEDLGFPVFLQHEYNRFFNYFKTQEIFKEAEQYGKVMLPPWYFQMLERNKYENLYNNYLIWLMAGFENAPPQRKEWYLRHYPFINVMVEDYRHVRRVLKNRLDDIKIYGVRGTQDMVLLFILSYGDKTLWNNLILDAPPEPESDNALGYPDSDAALQSADYWNFPGQSRPGTMKYAIGNEKKTKSTSMVGLPGLFRF